MAWLVLVLSGILEAGWATALHRSDGFRPLPSLAFAVAAPATLVGLAQAMRALPVGTAYAGRVGIGVPDGRVRDVVRCRTHQPLRERDWRHEWTSAEVAKCSSPWAEDPAPSP